MDPVEIVTSAPDQEARENLITFTCEDVTKSGNPTKVNDENEEVASATENVADESTVFRVIPEERAVESPVGSEGRHTRSRYNTEPAHTKEDEEVITLKFTLL